MTRYTQPASQKTAPSDCLPKVEFGFTDPKDVVGTQFIRITDRHGVDITHRILAKSMEFSLATLQGWPRATIVIPNRYNMPKRWKVTGGWPIDLKVTSTEDGYDLADGLEPNSIEISHDKDGEFIKIVFDAEWDN